MWFFHRNEGRAVLYRPEGKMMPLYYKFGPFNLFFFVVFDEKYCKGSKFQGPSQWHALMYETERTFMKPKNEKF